MARPGLLLLFLAAAHGEEPLPKPFGTGIGPVYIGGRDTDSEGAELSLKVYGQFINYRMITNKVTEEEAQHYAKHYTGNHCIGGCSQGGHCKMGTCVCLSGLAQIFGRCWQNSTAAAFVGNSEKYRKPEAPPKPDWCFCRKKKNNSVDKVICAEHKDKEECQTVHYPDSFDSKSQFCQAEDHTYCQSKDMNFFCTQKTILDPRPEFQTDRNVCGCRKDMAFDTKNMECRFFLDVDCTYVTGDGFTNKGNITEVLTGAMQAGDKIFTEEEAKQAFCLLLDQETKHYNDHIQGEFIWVIFGIGASSFFALCCGSICASICCCQCCACAKYKIDRMDPRNALKEMSAETQMAGLGAVAAGELIERRGEREDEARVQAMQGGFPGGYQPGYAPPPVGYPMPPGQGAGGYAPLPQGYGPAQQGYGQQPVYQQQGGFLPPSNQGMLGDVLNVAPELALAGAGAVTGNRTLAGLGVLGAADKFDRQDDNEDRLRAAAMNAPPPPMGYAGGAPLFQGQPPQMTHLPPATANYPRANY